MARPKGSRAPVGQGALTVGDEPIVDRRALRPRERLFVEAYCGVANGNATKAYALAGYKPGRENASRLTKKDHIAAAIEDGWKEREAVLEAHRRELLERLTRMSRGSVRPFLHPDDPLLRCDPETGARLISDEDIALIKAIKPGKHGRTLELHDVLHATETMAKIRGVLKDTNIKVTVTLEDIVAGAFEVVDARG